MKVISDGFAHNTRVLDEDGKEIRGIESLNISVKGGEPIQMDAVFCCHPSLDIDSGKVANFYLADPYDPEGKPKKVLNVNFVDGSRWELPELNIRKDLGIPENAVTISASGNPGSGKTVLLGEIAKYLTTKNLEVRHAYNEHIRETLYVWNEDGKIIDKFK